MKILTTQEVREKLRNTIGKNTKFFKKQYIGEIAEDFAVAYKKIVTKYFREYMKNKNRKSCIIFTKYGYLKIFDVETKTGYFISLFGHISKYGFSGPIISKYFPKNDFFCQYFNFGRQRLLNARQILPHIEEYVKRGSITVFINLIVGRIPFSYEINESNENEFIKITFTT